MILYTVLYRVADGLALVRPRCADIACGSGQRAPLSRARSPLTSAPHECLGDCRQRRQKAPQAMTSRHTGNRCAGARGGAARQRQARGRWSLPSQPMLPTHHPAPHPPQAKEIVRKLNDRAPSRMCIEAGPCTFKCVQVTCARVSVRRWHKQPHQLPRCPPRPAPPLQLHDCRRRRLPDPHRAGVSPQARICVPGRCAQGGWAVV